MSPLFTNVLFVFSFNLLLFDSSKYESINCIPKLKPAISNFSAFLGFQTHHISKIYPCSELLLTKYCCDLNGLFFLHTIMNHIHNIYILHIFNISSDFFVITDSLPGGRHSSLLSIYVHTLFLYSFKICSMCFVIYPGLRQYSSLWWTGILNSTHK